MSSPVDLLLAKLEGVKRSGDGGHQWVACCPAHEDAHQSLTVGVTREGVVLVHCYAGCAWKDVVASVGLGPGDLYPEAEGEAPPRVTPTVRLLAWDKRLPEEFLREQCKLADVHDGVEIPYANAAGEVIARKKRTDLVARLGSSWPAGQPLETYGQRALSRWRGAGVLVLVEGESDCWTLWHHGFPALGVPGSGGSRAVTAEQVEGFATIYVWQEPDAGGAKMVEGVAKRLAEVGWSGELRVVKGGPAKDPNALHQKDPEGFKEAFQGLLDAAEIVNLPEPGKEKKQKQRERREGKNRVLLPGIVADRQEETKAVGPPPSPGYFGLTDLGNAQRLVFRHGRDIRYCTDWKKWLSWNGHVWDVDAQTQVMQRAVDTVRSIYCESACAEAAELRQKLAEHAVWSEASRALHAMVDLSRNDRDVAISFRELNTDAWLLNCPNGTVDLRSGKRVPHRRENLITKCTATPFEADAPCPQWEKFLGGVFRQDPDLISYVQRLLGYFLTADTSTHMLPVFWGGGGNGKGTLLNTVLHVLGDDYSGAAVSDLLMARREGRHPTELADLYGKRLVVCQETDDGCRLNEPLVKWLTGGDKLKARRMREDFWEFAPTHKIVLSTNYRPVVRGTDRGIWRRLRLVPFTVTFSGDKEDRGLADRLKAEAAGILAWMVRGCLAWQREGEQTPTAVLVATSEYQQDEDVVQRFIADCCVTDPEDDSLHVQASVLYATYRDWVEKSNEGHPMSQTKFGRRVADLGFVKDKNNVIVYKRIAIQSRPASESKKTATENGNGDGSATHKANGTGASSRKSMLEAFDE